jgi:RNA polymerase sigma-70 factor (ECF subfamily)
VLDPEVVFRIDRGALSSAARLPSEVRGAEEVAGVVLQRGAPIAPLARPALVNGAAGLVVAVRGRTMAVIGFTIAGGRVVEIDLVADPEKLRAVTAG